MTGDGNTTINMYDIVNGMTASFNDAVTAVPSATAPSTVVYTEITNSYDNNNSLFESDVNSTTGVLLNIYTGVYIYSTHNSDTETSYNYDIRNRMVSASSDDGSNTSSATYTYNDAGERVSEVGTLTDTTVINVTYLYDTQNPTGYDQVIEERSSGTATSSFILGLGTVGQTTSGSSNAIIYLLKDGHGRA